MWMLTDIIDRSRIWPEPSDETVQRRVREIRREFTFKLSGTPISLLPAGTAVTRGQCITCGDPITPPKKWENGIQVDLPVGWRCDPCMVAIAIVVTGSPNPYEGVPEHVDSSVTIAQWAKLDEEKHAQMMAEVEMARKEKVATTPPTARQQRLVPLETPVWEPDFAPSHKLTVRLNVVHQGVSKMVGKVVPLPVPGARGVDAMFVHEESGSQSHFNTDSPGGVDVAVLHFLVENRVAHIVHISKGQNRIYHTSTATMLFQGIRETWDGRDRIFLPTAAWMAHERPWFPKTPWASAEKTVYT